MGERGVGRLVISCGLPGPDHGFDARYVCLLDQFLDPLLHLQGFAARGEPDVERGLRVVGDDVALDPAADYVAGDRGVVEQALHAPLLLLGVQVLGLSIERQGVLDGLFQLLWEVEPVVSYLLHPWDDLPELRDGVVPEVGGAAVGRLAPGDEPCAGSSLAAEVDAWELHATAVAVADDTDVSLQPSRLGEPPCTLPAPYLLVGGEPELDGVLEGAMFTEDARRDHGCGAGPLHVAGAPAPDPAVVGYLAAVGGVGPGVGLPGGDDVEVADPEDPPLGRALELCDDVGLRGVVGVDLVLDAVAVKVLLDVVHASVCPALGVGGVVLDEAGAELRDLLLGLLRLGFDVV